MRPVRQNPIPVPPPRSVVVTPTTVAESGKSRAVSKAHALRPDCVKSAIETEDGVQITFSKVGRQAVVVKARTWQEMATSALDGAKGQLRWR